jgi:formylglycine-generating enzyme required for sulfatase activity
MRIVLSYRRSDAEAIAGRIFDRLVKHYGDESVFMDIDSIPFGVDFRAHIRKELEECNILLAIIGPHWAGDRKHLRINEETDFVRIEIETALQRNIPVVPILIDETPMPGPNQLPDSLQPLAFRNAAPVDSGRDFHPHMARLIRELDRLCGSREAADVQGNPPQMTSVETSDEERRAPRRVSLETSAGPKSAEVNPQAEHQRPTGLSRRSITMIGLCGLGLASGGIWAGLARISRKQVPYPERTTFEVITVNSRGERIAPEQQTVEFFTQPIGIDSSLHMALIPAGEFVMGSPFDEPYQRENERPQHLVKVRRFAMSRTAITQAQWSALLRVAPEKIKRDLPYAPSFFHGATLPVESISWMQAEEFCDRLSKLTGLRYRLPSEAEWEYACRADTMSPFHFGPTITRELANYCGTGGAVCGTNDGQNIFNVRYDDTIYDSGAYGEGPVGTFRNGTTPVGSFPPNRFGLYDMHGNVWEHCLDTWINNYRNSPPDGGAYLDGRQDLRVLRGGSWSHNPAICRSAYRDTMTWDSAGWQGRVGLRVVCEIPND